MLEKLKSARSTTEAEIRALSIAFRDARTPWYAKALIGFIWPMRSAHRLDPGFHPRAGFSG